MTSNPLNTIEYPSNDSFRVSKCPSHLTTIEETFRMTSFYQKSVYLTEPALQAHFFKKSPFGDLQS